MADLRVSGSTAKAAPAPAPAPAPAATEAREIKINFGQTCKDVTNAINQHLESRGIKHPFGPSIEELAKQNKGKTTGQKIWDAAKFPFTTSISAFVK